MKKILFCSFLLILLIPFIIFEGAFMSTKSENQAPDKIHNQKERIKNNSYKAIVINLERDKNKIQRISKILTKEKIPFKRLNAIYGKNLSEEYIKSIVRPTFGRIKLEMPKGTIGCYLSHLNAWQELLKSNNEFLLILEDDITFKSEYAGKVKQIIEKTFEYKNLWDIMSFEIAHKGTPLKIKKFQISQIKDEFSLNVYLTSITHAGAYIINRRAAKELINHALPLNLNLDHYFRRTWEFNNIKFLGLEPRIATQTEDGIIITSSRTDLDFKQDRVNHLTIRRLSLVVYDIKTAVLTFIDNLFVYAKLKLLYSE